MARLHPTQLLEGGASMVSGLAWEETRTRAKRTTLREDNTESLHNQRRGHNPGLVDLAGAGGDAASTPLFFRQAGATSVMPEKMGEVIDTMRHAGSLATVRAMLDGLVMCHALGWGPAIVHAEQLDETGAEPPPVQVSWSEATLEVPLAGRFLAPLAAVMRHVTSVTLHTVWDAADYRTPGQGGEFYRAMSDFVTSRALRFGLSLPRAVHYRVGFSTSSAVLADRGQVLPLIAQVQVFATHLDELGRALLHSPYQLSPLTSPLDAAEAEVLQGLLVGRSTADLGLALRMSQASVRKRATSAAEKLECTGAHQAAARALHMGWLAA